MSSDRERFTFSGVRGGVREEWQVPAVFAVLVVGSLIYEAAHVWFWQRAHDMVWLAAPLLLVLLGLLLRRSRFAWWVFVVMSGAELVTWVVDMSSHAVTAQWVIGGLVGLVQFGLLVSRPMRRFVGFRGQLAPSPT